jgi:hypothetical protein
MEITKEYLDEKFDAINRQFIGVVEQIGKSEARLEAKMATMAATMATKDELKQTVEKAVEKMEKFVIDGFTAHQIWVKEEFKDLIGPYDKRITKVEIDVAELKLHKKALA